MPAGRPALRLCAHVAHQGTCARVRAWGRVSVHAGVRVCTSASARMCERAEMRACAKCERAD
eukprot:14856203-Alexandrium_andersonii.AAC.1